MHERTGHTRNLVNTRRPTPNNPVQNLHTSTPARAPSFTLATRNNSWGFPALPVGLTAAKLGLPYVSLSLPQ